MTIAIPRTASLEEFLKLLYIDESPASEYINAEAVQKPMGGGKHSLLQKRLIAAIDTASSNYEALPELRCTFGNRSIVPWMWWNRKISTRVCSALEQAG